MRQSRSVTPSGHGLRLRSSRRDTNPFPRFVPGFVNANGASGPVRITASRRLPYYLTNTSLRQVRDWYATPTQAQDGHAGSSP
jgi:hypothetical protein